MSLKKQYLKSKPVCKVTFTVEAEAATDAGKIELLGDFNEWNTEDAILLKKFKNGSFKVTIDLPIGKDYQFKYLVDGTKWENDWAADSYVNSGVGSEDNSVVSV